MSNVLTLLDSPVRGYFATSHVLSLLGSAVKGDFEVCYQLRQMCTSEYC